MTAGQESGEGRRPEDLDAAALNELTRSLLRRRWINVAVAETVWTLSVGAAALAALLVAGVSLMETGWLLAWALGTVALGVVRLIRARPQPYVVLQQVDRRLGLFDTLSTAFYFRSMDGDCQQGDEARATLFAQAEQFARQIDAARAEPVRLPRSVWVLAGLVVIASALFALRYGAQARLDLRPPVAAAMWPRTAPEAAERARTSEPALVDRMRRVLERLGLASQAESEIGRSPRQALTHEGGAGGELATAPPKPDLSQPVPTGLSEEGSELDEGDGRMARAGDGPTGDSQSGSSDFRQPWSNGNSDLLEKFREALASLLSQLKSRSSGSDSMAVESPEGTRESSRADRRGEKGMPGSGRQSRGEASTEAEGEQEGDATQSARGATGKSGGPDTDLQPAKEGRSGIGREDGRKETAAAEQLAAMGKLTELIGRRQATLTGEVTVEVASGTQKLRTPYAEREARHREAGGEISRDEVPLIFRDYVQRYLEEVRKAPPHGSRSESSQP